MTETVLELHWEGPFRLPQCLWEAPGLPEATGVYLWTLEDSGEHLIHYIGSAGNLRQRQYDHVIRTLGGGYWIPERVEGGYRAPPESYPARGQSWSASFERLRAFVEDADRRKRAWDYLHDEIRLFFARIDHPESPGDRARGAEYIMQKALGAIPEGDRARRAYCWPGLRGSRRSAVDRLVHGGVAERIVRLEGLVKG